jgi:anthranilate phosphoribosyltransferase
MLKEIASLIYKVSNRENLTSEETRKAFNVLAKEDSDGYYYLAFTLGLMAKGPSIDELYGICQSFDDRATKLNLAVDPRDITDLSGTGGDQVKTINVSTAASFIVAGAGLCVAKQAFKSFTGITGSIDVFQELGINVPLTNGNPKLVERALEKIGIAPYYYPAFSKEFTNRVNFIKKMREIGITFLTPYHLLAFAYSPIKMEARIYGVFSDKYLLILAKVLRRLGFKRGMVVHGVDGLDEVSNIGTTKICEFTEDNFDKYSVTPEELGIRKAKFEDIQAISREQNIIDFLKILYGQEKGPKRDIVLINAGASLYITGRAKNLKEGKELAESIVEEGKASQKLETLVSFMGEPSKLERWKKIAKIT